MKGGARIFSPITEATDELNNISMYLYSLDLLSYSFHTFPTTLPAFSLANKYVGTDFRQS